MGQGRSPKSPSSSGSSSLEITADNCDCGQTVGNVWARPTAHWLPLLAKCPDFSPRAIAVSSSRVVAHYVRPPLTNLTLPDVFPFLAMPPFEGGPPLRGQCLPVFGLLCDPRRPPCWRTTILAHLGHSTRWPAAVFWAGSSVAGFDFLTVFGFAAFGLRPFRTHTAHSEAPTGAIPMRQ